MGHLLGRERTVVFPLGSLAPELIAIIVLQRFPRIRAPGEMRLLLNLRQSCQLMRTVVDTAVLPQIQCIWGYAGITVRPTQDYRRFCASLTHLDISPEKRWNGRGQPHLTDCDLAQFTRLTSLTLCGNNHITDCGLHWMTGLTALNLSHNKCISDAGLASLTRLTDLNMAHTKITSGGLTALVNLQCLEAKGCEDVARAYLRAISSRMTVCMDDSSSTTPWSQHDDDSSVSS